MTSFPMPKKYKILVTGASGFVGRSFMQQFAARKDVQLLGIARRPLSMPNYLSVDLTQGLDIPFQPDVVIHAAAHVSPWGRKKAFSAHNVFATEQVIHFCKRNNLPRLVYLSSSSVFYQDKPQFDLTEESQIGPEFINEYAASKYEGEKRVRQYRGESVILRPRAVFGPGDTVLLPRILAAAEKGRLPILDSQAGAVIGDLIYIDSLCEYMLKAALDNNISGEYNLTNAEPVEMHSLLLDVLSRLGLPAPKRHIKVSTAMTLATVLENIYKFLGIAKEPPITRYGISVLAHSKTFNVEKMLRDFGPPSVSMREGVERYIQWKMQDAAC
nr:NAD(P)-dependent oxidoreductase [Candidatus Electrothrix aestuarii]